MGNEIDKTASLLSCDCRRFMERERERERETYRLGDHSETQWEPKFREPIRRFFGVFFLGFGSFFYKRRNCEHEKIREREERERDEEEN